jgi:hypothetical protein
LRRTESQERLHVAARARGNHEQLLLLLPFRHIRRGTGFFVLFSWWTLLEFFFVQFGGRSRLTLLLPAGRGRALFVLLHVVAERSCGSAPLGE